MFTSVLRAFRTRNAPGGSIGELNTENTNQDLACDRAGNLWVRNASGNQFTEGWSFTTPAYDDAAQIFTGTATSILSQVGGFNPTGAMVYVLLFDALAVPAPGALPLMSFQVPALGSFSWEPARGGEVLSFAGGLAFGVSSTGATYTPVAAGIWLFAKGWV